METILAYVTSDKFMHLAVFFVVMLVIITAADLLDLYNRPSSMQHKRRQKAATDNAGSARIP